MRRTALAVLMLALAAGLVGCGSSSPQKTTTVNVTSPKSGALKFTPVNLAAPAGKVVIRFTNPSSVGHSIAIAGASGQIVSNGAVSQVTATLKPGTYEFWCGVPGHKQAGMRGVLVVN